MSRATSVIEVDLDRVRRNVGVIRGLVGAACRVCAVVKQDGYGLGADHLAPHLVDAGASMLGVYALDHALELAPRAKGAPLLVHMPVTALPEGPSPEAARLRQVAGQVHLTLHDLIQTRALAAGAERLGLRLDVHLEIDTGMSRGGCAPAAAPAIIDRVASSPGLHLAGIFTHFASAGSDPDFTAHQHDVFDELMRSIDDRLSPDVIVHAANTSATLRAAHYHRTMVRVGHAWAGYGVECVERGDPLEGAVDLQPVVTWHSTLIHLKAVEAGSTVGYGASWTARRRSVIGLIPVGYADGLPAALSRGDDDADCPGAGVLVVQGEGRARRTHFAPIVGRVNMDQVTVDLTDTVRAFGDVARDTRVELVTPDRSAPTHLVRLAASAGTNPYEILCRLNPRLSRVYVDGERTSRTRESTRSSDPEVEMKIMPAATRHATPA